MNQNWVEPEPGELPPKLEPSEPELADPKPNRTEPGFAIPDVDFIRKILIWGHLQNPVGAQIRRHRPMSGVVKLMDVESS